MKTLKNFLLAIVLLITSLSCEAQMVPGIGQVITPRGSVSTPPVFTPIHFGRIYNWYVGSDPRDITPIGWHVPSYAELTTLINNNGGATIAGRALKETGFIYWTTDNTDVTNSSGYSMTGGGIRSWYDGTFLNFKTHGNLWAKEQNNATTAKVITMFSHLVSVSTSNYSKLMGVQLRFIKDDSIDSGYMIDNDGNVYPTVKIGDQVWMAACFYGITFRNGDTVPYVPNNADWKLLTSPGYCDANGNPINN